MGEGILDELFLIPITRSSPLNGLVQHTEEETIQRLIEEQTQALLAFTQRSLRLFAWGNILVHADRTIGVARLIT
jgi:hypothetical protein